VGNPGVFFTVDPGVLDTSMLESIEISEDTGCWKDGGWVRSSSVWDLSTGFRGNLSRAEEVRGVSMFTIGIDGWAFRTLSVSRF
jgi:hypothetical protein